jgi:hypothetical protein
MEHRYGSAYVVSIPYVQLFGFILEVLDAAFLISLPMPAIGTA